MLTAVLFFACAMEPGRVSVPCCLPEIPGWWDGMTWDEGVRVVTRNSDGGVEEVLFGSGTGMSLSLSRGVNTPVLVYPVGRTVPAGAVMPWDLDDNGVLQCSWEQGWPALLLFRLSTEGGVFRALNARRLSEEVMLRSGGDPWTLDMDYALRALSCGRFNVYGLSSLRCRDLVLSGVPGVWIPDNPFRRPPEHGEAGDLEFGPLEMGFHRYRLSGGGETMDIYITEQGWIRILTVSGVGQSGTW